MIAIIEGMTPAQYITALNANLIELAVSSEVETNAENHSFTPFVQTLNSDELVKNCNYNFRTSVYSLGMRAMSFVLILNYHFVTPIHRFQDNFLEDIFHPSTLAEVTALVSDDGEQIDLWGQGLYHYTTDGLTFSEGVAMQMSGGGGACSHMLKVNGVYYYYSMIYSTPQVVKMYTSMDKINFTLGGTVLQTGAEGQWDDTGMGNTFVWKEGSTWYMLYEAWGSEYGFAIGLATAPEAIGPWTKNINNPVIIGSGEGAGHPQMARVNNEIIKYNGEYYVYYHYDCSGPLGSIHRTHSPDLIHWTDEGAMLDIHIEHGSPLISYGDPTLVQFKGKSYLFFDGTSQSEDRTMNHQDCGIDNRPLAELLSLYP